MQTGAIGMTERQLEFLLNSYLAQMKDALQETPTNEKLKKLIEQIESGLKRP